MKTITIISNHTTDATGGKCNKILMPVKAQELHSLKDCIFPIECELANETWPIAADDPKDKLHWVYDICS